MRTIAALLVLFSSLEPLFLFASAEHIAFGDVDLDNPLLHVIPSSIHGSSSSSNPKDTASCGRVHIVGLSRVKLSSYTSSFHVLMKASEEMPERHYKKVEFFFHRNASAGLCQCETEHWMKLQMGQWAAVISPYEDGFLDIKLEDGISGSLTISLEEDVQHWRLLCLGLGFVLLMMAPIISNWAPFYYSSSMALGIFLVVLLLLFQGMKLLPMGRKNLLYLTLYGSVLGFGSLLVHYFGMFINSILVNLGLGEEMQNPVSVFVLLGIILAGAAIGYWIVRKFVLSEDGSVDTGIAQFVKWAMRITAAMLIFQSTQDSILAVSALIVCWNICTFITSLKLWRPTSVRQKNSAKRNLWQRTARQATANHRHAEFLSPPGKSGLNRTFGTASSPYAWSDSPTKGLVFSYPKKLGARQQDYYSSFHGTPVRKYSKKEWDNFTDESTREALADWASTPEVSDWIAENAHRLQLRPRESSDDSVDSSSDSSEETVVESGMGLFGWL